MPRVQDHDCRAGSGLRRGGYVIDFWGLGYDIAERMGLANDLGAGLPYSRDSGRRRPGRNVWPEFGTCAFDALTGGRFVTLRAAIFRRLLFEVADPSPRSCSTTRSSRLDEQDADSARVSIQRARARDVRPRRRRRRPAFERPQARLRPAAEFEKDLGYASRRSRRKAIARAMRTFTSFTMSLGAWSARVALHDDRTLFLLRLHADDESSPYRTTSPSRRRFCASDFGSHGWECAQILTVLDARRTSISIVSPDQNGPLVARPRRACRRRSLLRLPWLDKARRSP